MISDDFKILYVICQTFSIIELSYLLLRQYNRNKNTFKKAKKKADKK